MPSADLGLADLGRGLFLVLGTQAGPRTSDKDWRALKGSHADCLPSARFSVVYPREQLADHDNAALL